MVTCKVCGSTCWTLYIEHTHTFETKDREQGVEASRHEIMDVMCASCSSSADDDQIEAIRKEYFDYKKGPEGDSLPIVKGEK